MKRLSGVKIRVVLLAAIVEMLMGGNARAGFTFGEPVNVGLPINTEAIEGCPVFTADGLTMFFESDRTGGFGDVDVWVATRETLADAWSEPVNLGSRINTDAWDAAPNISPDGLSLIFASDRPGGLGEADTYVTTRASADEPWGEPVNLGASVNSAGFEDGSQITGGGLTLYLTSDRPGGTWDLDIWASTRPTVSDPWTEAVNLGPTINTAQWDFGAHMMSGGCVLLFSSGRAGGVGGHDFWIARRTTISDAWQEPVNLGPTINSTADDRCAFLVPDGFVYFHSDRTGGHGSYDLWRAPVESAVDLNGDGLVDDADICLMVDNWGADDSLCDIGPTPFGDGIVDVEDLIVLVEYIVAEKEVSE